MIAPEDPDLITSEGDNGGDIIVAGAVRLAGQGERGSPVQITAQRAIYHDAPCLDPGNP